MNVGCNRQITFEDLKGLRAEGYVRDSTLDQRDGFGPEIQRKNIQRFAESYSLTLGSRWYTEFCSGRSVVRRSQFQQFLEDARLDLFDVLLVDHTSRFGRNQGECIRSKEELQEIGKTVVFVSQGIISGSDKDFLSERINETLDEAYSRNLSRYVSAGIAEKATQGYAIGHAPLGYRHLKSESGRSAWAIPDERTLPALLGLLRGYSGGQHSFKSLAQELNAQGYRTGNGKPFTESSISTVLNNPFYEGKFYYHRGRKDQQLVTGVHEVPEEVKRLWGECQKVRRLKALPGNPSPRSREHRIYPLTGIMVCDRCREPFHGITNHSDGRLFRRMMHSLHRCDMRPQSIGAPRIEKEFSQRVLACISLDEGWQEAILRALANEGPKPDHSFEIHRLEAAMTNLKKQHQWGALADEEFQAEFESLSRQKRVLETPRVPAQLPNLERAAQLLTDLPALWEHPGVSPKQRREMAREVFQELRIREGRLVAVMPRPQHSLLFAYSIWRQQCDVGGERLS